LVDFRPDFAVLSLGFDTFHLDPLGSFRIETMDYATVAGQVRERLKGLERGVGEGDSSADHVPCLILLEGGYVVEKLGPNLLSFLKGWEEA
jgi:acetoin utilization deacetylase AcuC-like enzyme